MIPVMLMLIAEIIMADNCLACGKLATKGVRAPASSISFFLTRFLCQRCEESGSGINVVKIIGVRRSCARLYEMHEVKEKQLYDGTAGFVNNFKESDSVMVVVSGQREHQESLT